MPDIMNIHNGQVHYGWSREELPPDWVIINRPEDLIDLVPENQQQPARPRNQAPQVANDPVSIRIRNVINQANLWGIEKEEEKLPKYKDFEKTVSSVFNKKSWSPDIGTPFIGLELENEFLNGERLPEVLGWCVRSEASLRYYGFEYVQLEPRGLDDSFLMLKDLLEHLKARPQKLMNSGRSSTHVHFDVTRYSFLDLVNFSCLYWILEPFISHYCGKERKGNLFCLRLQDSTAGQTYLKEAIKAHNPWSIPLVRNEFRYASLNMASVQKFGSLEFRLLRGTDDYYVIKNWVCALAAIKSYALKFKTPRDLNAHFIKDIDAKDLPRAVLGDLFRTFNESFPKDASLEKEIRKGFLSVSQVLTSHKTFDFKEEIKEERRLKKLEREKLIQEQKEIPF